MTAPDYTDLCAQAEAAMEGTTRGPWECIHEVGDEVIQVYVKNTFRPVHEHNLGYRDDTDAEIVANARFITWARNNVPALIAAIRELEARVEGWIAPDIVDKLLDDAQPIMAEAYCGAEAAREAAEAKLAEVEKERDALRFAIEQLQGPLTVATLVARAEAAEARAEALAAQVEAMRGALEPLKLIADAYDANELDDEARKHWGRKNEHTNSTDPAEIELYQGRGGKRLLTLQDALNARAALTMETYNG